MAEYQNAILVEKNGETIKFFKYWGSHTSNACRIEIRWKDKNDEKQLIELKFKGKPGKPAAIMCAEAVVKYWPHFNPQKHDLVITSGHKHDVKKKTLTDRKARLRK